MATLEELRERIDQIDNEIVALLLRRADLVLDVKKTKREHNISVYSPERERQIVDRVLQLAEKGNFPQAPLEKIFINIISATRSLIGDLTVSYVGPEWSFAYEASLAQFGQEVKYCAEASIDEVVAKVERGESHYGVVPARESSGFVARTFDLLMQSNLTIIAELELRESLVLSSSADALSEITVLYADAQSFCRADAWIRASLPHATLLVERSAAGAAQKVRESKHAALLAAEAAAEQFGFRVLARSVEAEVGTDARFIVIGNKTPPPSGNDKTSLLCSVSERAGALREILQPFSDRNLTLLKIDSRPMRNRAWEYVFFIDVAGHQAESPLKEAIAELSGLCTYLRVLGSYRLVCPS